MGVLGWPPSEFWDATLHDLGAGLDGLAEKNGADPPEGDPEDVAAKLIAMFRTHKDYRGPEA